MDRGHPDKIQETRAEYNERFGQQDKTPEMVVPVAGQHLWDWYFGLSGMLQRTREGICEPIPPSEYAVWIDRFCGEIVYPHEYAILAAMDVAFCDEMNKELDDLRARQEEAAKRK